LPAFRQSESEAVDGKAPLKDARARQLVRYGKEVCLVGREDIDLAGFYQVRRIGR
jgi:hypothetical protein